MSTTALTLELLQQTLNQYGTDTNFSGTSNVVFLPEGKHKGRFLVDSTGAKFFTTYKSWGYFKQGIRDPESCDNLPAGFVNDLQPLYWDYLRHAQKWGRGRQETFLCYFYLIETNKPDENWQPNNLYCVIGKTRFANAFIEFFKELTQSIPGEILNMLNPNEKTPVVTIENINGRDGKCAISVGYPAVIAEPVDVTQFGYTSLDSAYIPSGFDEIKYNNLVTKYVEEIYKNKDYILKAKFTAEEKARSEACVKAGKPFVPGTQPNELIVEVNNHVYPNPLENVSRETTDDVSTADSAPVSVEVNEEKEVPDENPPVQANADTASSTAVDNDKDPFAGYK